MSGGRRRRPLAIALAAVAAAGLAFVLWLTGLPAGSAVALGAAVAVTGVAWSLLSQAETLPAWRPERPLQPGTRSDVTGLSWTLRPRGGGVPALVRGRQAIPDAGALRLRRFAAARLSRHGLDLLDPADRAELERLLGAGVVATLTGAREMTMTMTTAERCIAALETLDERGPAR